MNTNPYQQYKPTGISSMDEIPTHWEYRRLGQIGTFSKGSGGNKDDEAENGLPCIRYGDIYTSYKFHARHAQSYITHEIAPNYARIEHGDALFAGSGETIEDIGKSVVNLMTQEAYCGGDIILLKPKVAIHPSYLGYVLDCPQVAYQKSRMGRGTTIMHIYSSQLKYLTIPLPPIEEQSAIVCFLDRAGDLINRYIGAKQRLIALLEEQRQAVIHQAVTSGLDANASNKPSGVLWIGETPENWNIASLRYITECLDGARRPVSRELRANMRGEIPYWGANSIIDHVNDWIFDEPLVLVGEDGAPFFDPNRNVAFFTEGKIWPNNHIHVLRCNNLASPRFLAHVLNCVDYATFISGSTRDKLTQQAMGNIPVQIPPFTEQNAIVDSLDAQLSSTDHLIFTLNHQITLVDEYRNKLISDAVTGQIDVRNALVQPPE